MNVKSTIYKYHQLLKDPKYLMSLVVSVAFFALSLIVNFYAGVFATANAGNSVGDVILNNIRVFDVDAVFIYGPVILFIFTAFLCLKEPRRIPFVLKSLAVFILIRSLFTTLTHIGPYPNHLNIDYTSNLLKRFTFGGDLFFSGHTGFPFLLALIFSENKYLKMLFIATSICFGAVVLMAHIHYSIDVLAAFFITYTIHHINETIFREDRRVFAHGSG